MEKKSIKSATLDLQSLPYKQSIKNKNVNNFIQYSKVRANRFKT